MSCHKKMTPLSFFQFMTNFEQSGSWIPKMSVKLTFSLIVTFYLTNNENRTKKSWTQLSYYCFEQRYYLWPKMPFYKKADISKIMEDLVIKGIFSETTCVCTYVPNFKLLAQFWCVFNFIPSTAKQIPKKPTQIRVKEC